MKILYAASEAQPFIASGGLADVAGSLPKALCACGEDCRVVLPLYGDINPDLRREMRYITHFNVPLSWRNQYCGLLESQVGGVTYYLLDNEYYFKRNGIYGFYDDAERFAFFSKAVLEMIHYLDFVPQVIHCNDWQTAMVPVFLKAFYKDLERYRGIKTVFTIHNIQYQGKYGMEIASDLLGLPPAAVATLEYDGCINMMKGAIEDCDQVTTVSPTYAQEILDPWFAHGLDRELRGKEYKLTGILNGIDTTSYNPETDPAIFANYGPDDIAPKAVNKAELQKLMGLAKDPDVFLVGLVSRLVGHKGLDLVKYIFDDIIQAGMSVVVLGSGDYIYESFFREMEAKYPGKVAVKIGFIPQLARRIYAGADGFLMPSKSEPCGLSQMVALRYGTIPVVRETGGLRDSIVDMGKEGGNGYTFQTYNAHDMLGALLRAKGLYENKPLWKKAVVNALECDFSWGRSAQAYLDVYQKVIG